MALFINLIHILIGGGQDYEVIPFFGDIGKASNIIIS